MSPVARYVVETTVTLLAIIALAVLVLYAARRVGVGKPGGKVFVVGGSEAGLSKLGEVDDDGLTLTADPPSAAFSDVLGRVLSKKSPNSESDAPDYEAKSDDSDDGPKRESAA